VASGVSGAQTPDGILTRLNATALGRVVKEIEARPEPATIDLGLMLLTLDEDTVKDISRAIDDLAVRAGASGKHDNLTVAINKLGGAGLTIHCNDDERPIAADRLRSYCYRRKYQQKANQWFGICMSPQGPSVRFGVTLSYPWEQDDVLDRATRGMQAQMPAAKGFTALRKGKIARKRLAATSPVPVAAGSNTRSAAYPESPLYTRQRLSM
jgi:hypothetical protein